MKTVRVAVARGLGLCLALSLAVCACSDNTGSPVDGSIPCSADEDCPVGQACIGGICQEVGGDDDAQPCEADADCPVGAFCDDGFCREAGDGGIDGGDGDGDAGPAGPDIEILAPPTSGDPPVHVLDFGSVMVGQPVAGTIRLRNAGDQPLQLLDLAFEMGTVEDFSLDPATLDALPQTVEPGAEFSFDVTYRASDGMGDVGVLAIISNDPDEARVTVQLVSEFKGTAALAVEPGELAFGDVMTGDQARLNLTVSNQGSGNAVLTVDEIQLGSLASEHFHLEDLPAFPAYLNRGDALELGVVFHPATTGELADRVVIASDDPDDPQLEIPLSGRGVVPDLVVDPAPVDFGEVRIGESLPLEISLTNAGGAPLAITGIAFASDSPDEFALSSDPATGFDLAALSPDAPQLLQPDETRFVSLAYSPADSGADAGSLLIDCPDIEPPQREVAVAASGYVPPIIEVDPLELDFGDLHLRADTQLPLVVRNLGGRFLEISSLVIEGGMNAFSIQPQSLPNIAPDEEASLQVTFAPTVTGGHEGRLDIESNDPELPLVEVSLFANGIDPDLFVMPFPPIDFGQVYRGQHRDEVLHVAKAGVGPLRIDAIEMSIGSSQDFTLLDVPDMPVVLQTAADVIQVTVRYLPPAVGDDSGAVRIDSSDLDNPSRLIALQGEGIGCAEGHWDINGDPADGCEYACTLTNGGVEACDTIDNDCDAEIDEDFDTDSDPDHCGMCNNECTYPHATGLCIGGSCTMGACDDGHWDVNGDPADGCEYACTLTNGGVEICDTLDNDCDDAIDEDFDTDTDPFNCGACGNICDLNQADAVCVDGACAIDSCADGFADCDGLADNGCEIDILTDPDNCNGCGNVCSFPNAPAVCDQGACEPGDCSDQFADCNGDPLDGCETNLMNDEQNCGGCGQACSDPNEACVDGACSCGAVGPDCTPEQTCCGIECVDVMVAPLHCGGCGIVCQAGEQCVLGLCSCGGDGPDCSPDQICCGSSCHDPDASNDHCGACDNTCDDNEICTSGDCLCGGVGPDCDAPLSCCGTGCVDLQTSEVHCGACDAPCDTPHTNERCEAGVCQLISCEAGWADCGPEPGCETHIDADVANCGSCGLTCSNPHGSTACVDGACTPSCDALWGDCDGDPNNGCEQDLTTLDHCGGCGQWCSLANASETCASGACEIDSCSAGYADFFFNDTATTEIYTDSDEANCGTCGNTCSNLHGNTNCNSGVCVPVCTSGWGDCDGDPDNGCETYTDGDVGHCGDCATQCTNPNGTTSCSAGVCQPTCDSGFGDCDGDPSNGCETDLWQPGACGPSCGSLVDCSVQVDNATGISCSSGACDYTSCNAGWDDCDGDRSDGCETDIWQTVSCGSTCGDTVDCNSQVLHASGISCAGGACDYTACDAGWGDCDGDRSNGCETDIWLPGSCGNGCAGGVDCTVQVQHASGIDCNAGVCDYSACDAGWGDCDGDRTNGCESDLWQPGSCGNACAGGVDCSAQVQNASGISCNAGVCDYSACDAGFGDCNGDRSDGCETDIWQTSACGLDCGSRVNCNSQVQNAAGIVCDAGDCNYASCDAGFGNCDGDRSNGCETDLWQTGACGSSCGTLQNCFTQVQNASGVTCASGACDYGSCDSGYGDCDGDRTNGCETDLWQTAACGPSCGSQVNCNGQVENASGITCSNGACDYGSCDAGYADCDGDRSDGCETDIWQAASCGTTCLDGVDCTVQVQNAGGITCDAGSCDYGSCASGYGDCDGDRSDGCESDIWQTSSCGSNCGDRVDCTVQVGHASGVACTSGSCTYGSCDAGWGDCDGDASDGCESDIWQTSSCGTTCGNRVNCASQVQNASGVNCASGSCDYSSCDAGYGDCDGDRSNGCETSLWLDSSCGPDCGSRVNCFNEILNASGANCDSGACDYASCDAGYGDCDGDRSDGCETNLWQTGSCGTTCGNRVDCFSQIQNASGASCNGGTCAYSACNAGWGDCNGDASDGCETSLWLTAACGTNCGNRVDCNLQVQNATGVQCSAGGCDYLACVAGWGDCDGNRSNGCETDLWQTAACGNTCGGRVDCNLAVNNASGVTCDSGSCDYTACDAGYGDCDGDRSDGCEVDIWQTSSCGTNCGNRVDCTVQIQNASGASCDSGSCDYTSCSSGYGDCDGDRSDGCETFTDGNVNHCGGCGLACSLAHATPTCSGGDCYIQSCDSNYYDVDLTHSTGCECGDTADIGDTCLAATDVGTITTDNATFVTMDGTLVHRSGGRTDMDCYTVDFQRGSPGSGTFRIYFNPAESALRMDVYRTGCNAGDQICADEDQHTSTCSSPSGVCTTGNNNTFTVCVKAASGYDGVCEDYSLRFDWVP